MIDTEISTSLRVAVHKVRSTLSAAQMAATMLTLRANPAFDDDFNVVWDLREGDVDISFAEILDLDPDVLEVESGARRKVAWVPASALGESIINLIYAEHDWKHEWRTFTTLEAAMVWAADSG